MGQIGQFALDTANKIAAGVQAGMERATGGTYQQMREQGAQNYPELPDTSRHHAQAAENVTKKLVPYLGKTGAAIAANAMGVGVEGLESAQGNPYKTEDTVDDYKANLRGSLRGAGFKQPAPSDVFVNMLRRKFRPKNRE